MKIKTLIAYLLHIPPHVSIQGTEEYPLSWSGGREGQELMKNFIIQETNNNDAVIKA